MKKLDKIQKAALLAELAEAKKSMSIVLTQEQWDSVNGIFDRSGDSDADADANPIIEVLKKVSLPVPNATCLHMAAQFGYKTIAELMLEVPGQVNAIAGRNNDLTPLFSVISSPHNVKKETQIPILKSLLSHQADINMTKEDGTTPLIMAAINGRVDLVKILFEHNARPDLRKKSKSGVFGTIKHSSFLDCFMEGQSGTTGAKAIVDLFKSMSSDIMDPASTSVNSEKLENFKKKLNTSLDASRAETRSAFFAEVITSFNDASNKASLAQVIQSIDIKYNKEFVNAFINVSKKMDTGKSIELLRAVLSNEDDFSVLTEKLTTQNQKNEVQKLLSTQAKKAVETRASTTLEKERTALAEKAALEKKEAREYPIHALIKGSEKIDKDKLKIILHKQSFDHEEGVAIIDKTRSDKHSPLSLAIKNNNWDAVIVLLQYHASPDLPRKSEFAGFQNVLNIAMELAPERIPAIVRAIDPVTLSTSMLFLKEGGNQDTLLHFAIKNENIFKKEDAGKEKSTIKIILDTMLIDQINKKNEAGETPLNLALKIANETKNWQTVQLLLNKKVKIDNSQENIEIAIDRETVNLAKNNSAVMEKLFFVAINNNNVEQEARADLYNYMAANKPDVINKLFISAVNEGNVADVIDMIKFIDKKALFPTGDKNITGIKSKDDEVSIIRQILELYLAHLDEEVTNPLATTIKVIAKENPTAFYKECKKELKKLSHDAENAPNQVQKMEAIQKQIKICELGMALGKDADIAENFTRGREKKQGRLEKYYIEAVRSNNLTELMALEMEGIEKELKKTEEKMFTFSKKDVIGTRMRK